jgi:hypothetical protein
MNDGMLEKLETIADSINNKFKCGLQGTFQSSKPYYILKTPIILPKNRNFEAALIYISTDNYLANITSDNNKLIYSLDAGKTWKTILISTGCYELNSLRDEIFRLMDLKETKLFTIDVNLNTFNSIIEIKEANFKIDFTKGGTIRDILGFTSTVLSKGRNVSTNTIQITNSRSINIHCDLITGSYNSEGDLSDIIYSFPAYKVGPGKKISEDKHIPRYFPVIKQVIDRINFRVTDNNNAILDFKDEPVAWCIYIQQV